jgi:hypothetical protein
MGKVRIDAKNILLVDSVAEKLAAVRHANGVDYWVLTHGFFNNRFYAFQLSSDGLGNPIVSEVGTVHQGGGQNGMWGALGQMKISPDGTRIALGAINGMSLLEVFSFNTSTGVVSDAKRISSIAGAYGVAFSPDGSKLYETTILTQYDLTAGDGDIEAISASAYQYHNPNVLSFTGGELGPDGKLYLYKSNNAISVIHYPNEHGSASGLDENVYSLQADGWVYGFPSFIAGFNYSSSGFCNPNGLEEEGQSLDLQLHLHPNPASQSIRLQASGHSPQPKGITITDMLGKTVMNLQLGTLNNVILNGAQGIELDISPLPTGIYTVSAQLIDGPVLRSRLVVQR